MAREYAGEVPNRNRTLYIEPEIQAEATEIAKELGWSLSGFVEHLLYEAIKQKKKGALEIAPSSVHRKLMKSVRKLQSNTEKFLEEWDN